MTQVLCYVAGVLLATLLRFTRWKAEEGAEQPIASYWKRHAWQSLSSAILAVVLLFLWTDRLIVDFINSIAPEAWTDLPVTNLSSLCAGAALDFFGEYIVRIAAAFVRKKLPESGVNEGGIP